VQGAVAVDDATQKVPSGQIEMGSESYPVAGFAQVYPKGQLKQSASAVPK